MDESAPPREGEVDLERGTRALTVTEPQRQPDGPDAVGKVIVGHAGSLEGRVVGWHQAALEGQQLGLDQPFSAHRA